MKKLSLFVVAFLLGACAKNVSVDVTSIENKDLEIVSIELDDKLYQLRGTSMKPSIIFERGTFYGFAGCNRFFGKFEQQKDRIMIKDSATTKMMCEPDLVDFENKFLGALQGNFKIRENDQGYSLIKEGVAIHLK